jgi:CelD/BcsL family acetyltransferase involved in cellulose biosynthesis
VVHTETGSIDLVDRLAGEWRSMCRENPTSQPFVQPEWVHAYLAAFAPQGRLRLITARRDGRLTGVLPLIEERQRLVGWPVTVLRGAANVHSCRFDLATAADVPPLETVGAMWEHLRARPDWTLLLLPDLPEDGPLAHLQALARRTGSPTVQYVSLESPYFTLAGFDGNWESWLSRLKGDFRRELRRRKRKLASGGTVRFRRLTQADAVVLERFYALEASGWKGEAGTAIAGAAATRRFYDEIAAAASRLGYFSLYLLEVDDRVIAGHFGLTHNGRYYVPKLAYDEAYSAFSPGHLLVSEVARDCAERGVQEFEFLGPWMDWKASWASTTRCLVCLHVFRNDSVGRALYGLRFGLRSLAKRILGRAG